MNTRKDELRLILKSNINNYIKINNMLNEESIAGDFKEKIDLEKSRAQIYVNILNIIQNIGKTTDYDTMVTTYNWVKTIIKI
jgi:hypothetical protein